MSSIERIVERTIFFLPSILLLALLVLVTKIYLKLIQRIFGDKLLSIEWMENNQNKFYFMYILPWICIRAPAREELLYRMPLLIAFSSINFSAWFGILISAVIFGLRHGFGEIISAKEKNECVSDDLKSEVERFSKKNGQTVKKRRIWHVVFTFLLGILLGYAAVYFQSIWVPFWIHILLNSLVTILASATLIFICIIALALYGLSGFECLAKKIKHLFRR